MNNQQFKKKVYRKLERSPFSDRISFSRSEKKSKPKKIIPTKATQGIREEFKKTFLPLLIDIFELRQMIDAYKSHVDSPSSPLGENLSKSPQEIIEDLKQLQADIEESQRWCEGVILQIAKGIEEAKEALGEEEEGLIKRILRRIGK